LKRNPKRNKNPTTIPPSEAPGPSHPLEPRKKVPLRPKPISGRGNTLFRFFCYYLSVRFVLPFLPLAAQMAGGMSLCGRDKTVQRKLVLL
jgi:hypothetical protein